MMLSRKVPIADIYVPTARRRTLDAAAAGRLAEDILEHGLKTPILVRAEAGGAQRHVLVEGLHRLEAARLLGETEIDAFLVQARKF